MAKTNLEGLDLAKLQLISRQLEADMHNKDLDDIAIREGKDEGFYQRRIARQLSAFENNAGFAQSKLGDDGKLTEAETSRERFISSAGEKGLSEKEIATTESLLLASGFANTTTNGELSDEERANSIKLAESLKAGKTVLGLRGEHQETAARIVATNAENNATVDNGLKAMGFKPEDATGSFTQVYGDRLQIDEGTNFRVIESKMKTDPAYRAKIVGIVAQELDLREQVGEKLTSDNPEQIKQAQAILRLNGHEDVRVTGKMDLATAKAGQEYIEDPRELGNILEFHQGKFAGHTTEQSINRGTITLPSSKDVPNNLVELKQLAKDWEGASPTEYATDLSDFLANPEMRDQYNEFLKGAHTADLTAKYSADLEAQSTTLRGGNYTFGWAENIADYLIIKDDHATTGEKPPNKDNVTPSAEENSLEFEAPADLSGINVVSWYGKKLGGVFKGFSSNTNTAEAAPVAENPSPDPRLNLKLEPENISFEKNVEPSLTDEVVAELKSIFGIKSAQDAPVETAATPKAAVGSVISPTTP